MRKLIVAVMMLMPVFAFASTSTDCKVVHYTDRDELICTGANNAAPKTAASSAASAQMLVPSTVSASAAAEVIPNDWQVKIGGDYYPTLQKAYNIASNDDFILLRDGVQIGTLVANNASNANHPVITIIGGYDAAISTITGMTTIDSTVALQQGRVNVQNLIVRATTAISPLPVILGMSGNFVILAKTGVSTTGTTAVTGNIGLSPAAASYITGFGLIADSTNAFSTSSIVTGKVYASDYVGGTTSVDLTTAVGDMQTAYTDAAGRTVPAAITELGAGDISGLTLAPGLYKWGTGVLINSNVTLNGGPNDVWIFQIAKGLTQATGTRVALSGGALAKNIFWQCADVVDIKAGAHFEGVILAQTLISLKTGATINGRLLAQTAVTLDASTVTQPAL